MILSLALRILRWFRVLYASRTNLDAVGRSSILDYLEEIIKIELFRAKKGIFGTVLKKSSDGKKRGKCEAYKPIMIMS